MCVRVCMYAVLTGRLCVVNCNGYRQAVPVNTGRQVNLTAARFSSPEAKAGIASPSRPAYFVRLGAQR